MTGRTHDLAVFTALSIVAATNSVPQMSLGTLLVALSANFIGGLAPDVDQPTADLWHRIPAGSIIGRLITPLLGSHRYISHSIIGVYIIGFLLRIFLDNLHKILLVDMTIVWWAFMIGYISHLFMDIFTTEGVPLLFPIPLRFGIPPFRFLRMKTGGMMEKTIVFPGLLLLAGYVYYLHYSKFLDILRHTIKY